MNRRLPAMALALVLVGLPAAEPPAGAPPEAVLAAPIPAPEAPAPEAAPAVASDAIPGATTAPVATVPGEPAVAPATDAGAPVSAAAMTPGLPSAAPELPMEFGAAAPVQPADNPELRFNFKGAPLDAVLDYLSRAGGFVIVRDAPVTGTVDIVSHNPLTADEAVSVLHTILNDHGYAVLRSDRVLRVVRRDDARARDIPVVSGNDPEEVPRTSELVTQVISLRHTKANKLVETLKPLVPTGAAITTNEDSNAVVITDTRASIRRLMEVIQALDSTVASILDIRVIPLAYADAVETADVINKVYETPTSKAATQSGRSAGRAADFFARMRGGFGPPGADGAAAESGGDESAEARQTAVYVKAVADQRGNAVVVTAPADTLPQIADLVAELDLPTEAVTAVRVFALRFADATQMANVIMSLYPDSSTVGSTANRGRGGFFGGPAMPFGGQPAAQSSSTQSQRKVTEAKVLAVADTRTNSVIVSASSTTMVDIETVVSELDTSPANVPTVHVYQLQNGDVNRVKEVLNSMFEDLDSTGASSSRSGAASTRSRTPSTTTNRSTTGSTTQRNTGTSGAVRR